MVVLVVALVVGFAVDVST